MRGPDQAVTGGGGAAAGASAGGATRLISATRIDSSPRRVVITEPRTLTWLPWLNASNAWWVGTPAVRDSTNNSCSFVS